MKKIILFANWGLGELVLKQLLESSSIELQTNAIHFVLKALPQLYFFYTKD